MKKLVVTGNILSALPATIVVPLVPFIFILIEGEGRIPGFFHEYTLRILMVVYPLALIACVILSIRWMKQGLERAALWVSLVPLGIFALLLVTFLYGGIILR